MRVLLSGGSGFIAAHCLDILLAHGHSVVTTVRSHEKGNKIKENHKEFGKDKLDYVIVEDIAKEGAFEEAVKSDPPFEAVLHTASPFHFKVNDVQKELLDPAIIGTTGILRSIKKHAPTVKRVVITSSFASIVDGSKGAWPEHTYSEKDWNPITHEAAVQNPANGYRASKTFAEKAAWKFVEDEKPNFSIATICPPLVFGPVVHYLNTLSALNTSNERIRDFMHGAAKEQIPETGTYLWVDVRDVALAHVKAAETEEAGGKRFFLVSGHFSNKQLGQALRKGLPNLASKLPSDSTPGGDFPEGGVFKIDNSRSREVLGIQYRQFDSTIVDTAKSLQSINA